MGVTIVAALEIIKNHQTSAPVDVLCLAHHFGLRVFGISNWDNNLSGKIVRVRDVDMPDQFAIYVNQKHPIKRKRFTIAHELAHFIYHQDLIGDEITDDALYRSGLSNREEAMANGLAADILMPWHLINREIDNGLQTIDALADKFEVSFTAMAIRLGSPC
jgi:Zn-dependent peptidase ImmA (M78 family)